MIGRIIVAVIAITLYIAVWELPVIVAYLRGLRRHRLNVIIGWTGIGGFLMFMGLGAIHDNLGAIVLVIPWVFLLVMAFVYKPGVTRWRR